jgi:hypothetical protein
VLLWPGLLWWLLLPPPLLLLLRLLLWLGLLQVFLANSLSARGLYVCCRLVPC